MTYWTTRNSLHAAEFHRLHDRINHFMGRTFAPATPMYPAINVWTHEEGVVVTAELPGVDPKSLDITTLKGALTIKGTVHDDKTEDEKTWRRRDRRRGAFARTIRLPDAVDHENIQAALRDGVLEVRFQRTTAQKPKKVDVTTG